MYNPKDIQHVGKHDYNREEAEKYASWQSAKSFSVNIFKWKLKANGKTMKPGKGVVRVSGSPVNKEYVFAMADEVVKRLDAGTWTGHKTVSVK